jgi:hypothetical protein
MMKTENPFIKYWLNHKTMSTWITIKEQEDVEYDSSPMTEDSIDVFLNNDDFGNNYVTIPVSFILKVLTDNGYEIK